MDESRFDDLTRSLSADGWTRRELARGASRVVAALGLGALASGLAATRAKPKRGKKGKKKNKKSPTTGCAAGTTACQGTCIPAADCCPQPDAQTCQGRCGNLPNNCGQSVACGGCPAGESCTAGGQCEPDDACGPTDCGPRIDSNDLEFRDGQCRCKEQGQFYSGTAGLCTRHAHCGGQCAKCCPGGYALGAQCVKPEDDFICVNETASGCTCPPGKPQSCNSLGFGVRCRADFNDPRACGNSCETCDDHECCINGTCFNRMGCGPGFGGGGCTDLPCGSCTFFCPPETPLCCGIGPAAVPTCVAGTHCPPLGP